MFTFGVLYTNIYVLPVIAHILLLRVLARCVEDFNLFNTSKKLLFLLEYIYKYVVYFASFNLHSVTENF